MIVLVQLRIMAPAAAEAAGQEPSVSGRAPEGRKRYRRDELDEEAQLELVPSDDDDK